MVDHRQSGLRREISAEAGWGSLQEEASVLKAYGSDVIKLTQQSLRSWLKEAATLNLWLTSVTLLVSQLPRS